MAEHSSESALDEAKHAQEKLLPAMTAIRTAADALEAVVADDLWPLPTYQEMLYISEAKNLSPYTLDSKSVPWLSPQPMA